MCKHCIIKKFGSGSRIGGGKSEPMSTYFAGDFYRDEDLEEFEHPQIIWKPAGFSPEKFYLGRHAHGGITITHCPWCAEELFPPLDISLIELHDSAKVKYFETKAA